MKIAYSLLLVLSLLVEALAAASLIGGPDGVAVAGRGEQWAMHYGFAALAIASLSLWAWPSRTDKRVVTVVLGMLSTFHSAILLSLLIAGDQPAGVVIHAVLASSSIALFFLRSRWTS